MENSLLEDSDFLRFLVTMDIVSQSAFSQAQRENREKNIPNVYANNKGIYYELPDGTIVSDLQPPL